MLRKNDVEQKGMAEKIQKAKEAYYKMAAMIQQQTAWEIKLNLIYDGFLKIYKF